MKTWLCEEKLYAVRCFTVKANSREEALEKAKSWDANSRENFPEHPERIGAPRIIRQVYGTDE